MKTLWQIGIPVVAYLIILTVLLVGGEPGSKYIFILLLFTPFLDKRWTIPRLLLTHKKDWQYLLLCGLAIVVLLGLNQTYISFFISGLVFTALPEEWFFRGYLLKRAGSGLGANIIVSVAFAALHAITQSVIMAFLIFFPSLFYGWVYQKTNNIYLVVLLHALSNFVFVLYIKELLQKVI